MLNVQTFQTLSHTIPALSLSSSLPLGLLDCIQCYHSADVRAALECPCVGVRSRTSLMSSSLLSQ